MAEADRPIGMETIEFHHGPGGDQAPPLGLRRVTRLLLIFCLPAVLLALGAWFWLSGGRTVSTDNAYVKQDVVAISGDVGGRIVQVGVRENQLVKAGDILFVIDPEPYRVALAQADAQVAEAQVKVGELRTDYRTSAVSVEGAKADVRFAEAELDRQKQLFGRGFATRARLDAAENALSNARLREQQALVEQEKARAAAANGPDVPGVNPQLATALAQREKARLDLRRTVVRAPVAGRVSQSGRLQIGQLLVSGLPALSLVASDRSWIDANFKESQLEHIRAGQPVSIHIDAFPSLRLEGHVEGIGSGTGAVFSILPAQNSNGNWVKVTQRVPVRIAIDDRPPRPLIAGLSAQVTVDIQNRKRRANGRG